MHKGAAAAAMSATPRQTLNTSNLISLLITSLLLLIVPSSEASFWRSPKKTVTIQNWDKAQISIRCFSFNNERQVQDLIPLEEYSFTFCQSVLFPTLTMWNCSTSEGVFTVFKDGYDCNKNRNNPCKWKFNLKNAYRFSPKYNKWIKYEYNPNYESQKRGGVVKGQY